MAGCSQAVVEIRAMHIITILINVRNSAYDFSIKLSSGMCSPGWRNGSNLLDVIPKYTTYLLVHNHGYYAHVTVDSDKSFRVPLQISKSAVGCLLSLPPQ